MFNTSSFNIFNASAGSGKTFTLVKNYLKLLIVSDTLFKFKQILAITFTNKAVSEMKTRVIDMLRAFADESVLNNPNDMFIAIVEELNINEKKVHEKSKLILDAIINNYAAFDVCTIDGFTHKIIRTFAHDLKLPQNFEVELDTESIINKAVDNLIAKAGNDNELTNVLVDFALEKTDDDKSWDISYDLNKVAKLLINENHATHLENLQTKTLDDFNALKNNVFKKIAVLETHIQKNASLVLNLIQQNSLDFEHFYRSILPNHFKKIASLDLHKAYENKLHENIIERTNIYKKTLPEEKKTIIDGLMPKIEPLFLEIKQQVHQYLLFENILKNITPLSVLNAINKELVAIKEDENVLLVSEFNTLIANEIKQQPVPFIYERIGEKFKHYFIDEFQDTSVMQWDNLKPLLENALTSETLNKEQGSLMLVGDAKQAIYRWRGGKAEQFINLFNENVRPFPVIQNIENLPKNYRSAKQIVDFNNHFFKHVSCFAFSNEDYAKIYSKSHQETSNNIEGYVNLTFLNYGKDDDKDHVYTQQALETIDSILQKGYQHKDICVLVRKRKEGVAIANVLSNFGVPIISSETLMLQNSTEVMFVINMMLLALQPENYEVKVEVLDFWASQKNIVNKHEFFKNHIKVDVQKLFTELAKFDFNNFLQLPIYDAVEYVIRTFNLNNSSSAYIQFFLDEVYNYSQKQLVSFSGFIDYWNTKKDSLNIVSPIGQNAVQIMTIHKAKGLEFPVVIFPYAELSIYDDKDPKTWYELPKEDFNGFDEAYINLNKNLEPLNLYGKSIYNNYLSELELDNINLLYVALTRPIEQLYVIGKRVNNSKGSDNTKTYSGLLINYLETIGKWNDNEWVYHFGNPSKDMSFKSKNIEVTFQKEFISTEASSHNIKIITNSGYLWDTSQKEAQEKGNLVHEILSKIKTEVDIDFVLNDFMQSGRLDSYQNKELKHVIHEIVNHEDLKNYFCQDDYILNEQDIITKSGAIFRPDRIIIKNNQAVIIDYKTGLHTPKHTKQLQEYADVLREMNLIVAKKILVYINDDIEVKEV